MGIGRNILDTWYPDGPPHQPKPDGDMDNFREATGEIIDEIREGVVNTAFIRNPEKTQIFNDLEREYGIVPNPNLTLAERTDLLKVERYKKKTTGNDDDLQEKLDNAGFNLTVYQNSPDGPAVDPALFLDQNFQMQAQNGTNYYAGNTLAYAGRSGGELLVNGDVFTYVPAYFGAGEVYAGNTNAVCGYFETLTKTKLEYAIPVDPNNWPFVFFVGGAATFNPDGSLLTIAQGLVPSEKEKQLKDIILKFKGLYTWCGLVVTFN